MNELKDQKQLLSNIPSMTLLLQHERVSSLTNEYLEAYVNNCLRKSLDEVRRNILDGWIKDAANIPDINRIVSRAEELVRDGLSNKLMRAVNGAGVILHTGLGRAPLPQSAQDALKEAASRYCILATDRDTGKRGDRNRHNEELLCELTGAEAVLIVNNNSAAVMLALNTFGNNLESIVSRGELVEIGGSFRVPDVMRRSGTIMVEVGTTNKTHLHDYENAITEETAILLKVHTSNYRIEGFHKEVPVKELAELARSRHPEVSGSNQAGTKNLVLIEDIGSGALVDIRRWGLAYEPTVPEAIADGADVVTFSGDKMLGGPQCGVIVGRKELVDEMKSSPLMRAFRCGKLTHSALNGTLRLFLDPDRLPETHPVYAMIATPLDVIKRRASRIARRLRRVVDDKIDIETINSTTQMGSGSLPARDIPSRVVVLTPLYTTAEKLAHALRLADPPIFTRIEADKVIIDARTVADEEAPWIDRALKQVVDSG